MGLVLESNMGFVILLRRQYSKVRGDHYLEVVLGYSPEDGKYVTWVYNKSTKGFSNGHYFTRFTCDHDAENSRVQYEALQDYMTRSPLWADVKEEN